MKNLLLEKRNKIRIGAQRYLLNCSCVEKIIDISSLATGRRRFNENSDVDLILVVKDRSENISINDLKHRLKLVGASYPKVFVHNPVIIPKSLYSSVLLKSMLYDEVINKFVPKNDYQFMFSKLEYLIIHFINYQNLDSNDDYSIKKYEARLISFLEIFNNWFDGYNPSMTLRESELSSSKILKEINNIFEEMFSLMPSINDLILSDRILSNHRMSQRGFNKEIGWYFSLFQNSNADNLRLLPRSIPRMNGLELSLIKRLIMISKWTRFLNKNNLIRFSCQPISYLI